MESLKYITPFFLLFSLLPFQKASFSSETSRLDSIDFKKFETPFCMIGNGNHGQSLKKKYKHVRKLQKNISRRTKHFQRNKWLEKRTKLKGSPKWIANNFFKKKGLTFQEKEFAYFAMTLFAEAKNQDPEGIEMVARVINNRKKNKSYKNTVTKLAQFSPWYYKNRKDNAQLLCPSKAGFKKWKIVVSLAKKQFQNKDKLLGSTHYFAPKNMVPRYKIPGWAKGKKAVAIGDHVFIVKKGMNSDELSHKTFSIPKKARKLKLKGTLARIY